MNITTKLIDKAHSADINIPNEEFPLCGRMKVTYQDDKWSYEVIHFEKEDWGVDIFPDENYDFDELAKEHLFVGAYDGEKCIGLAIYRHSWNKYLYLYDLKVNGSYRGAGVGRLLIEAGKVLAKEHGYHGIYTQGQDNNLNACLFYVKNGFEIGGLETHVYKGTSQEGKSDIIFYLTN